LSASKGLTTAAIAIGIIALVLSGVALAITYVPGLKPVGSQPKTRAFTILIGDKEVVGENATTGEEIVIGEYHLFKPDMITVYKGDTVSLTLKNMDSHAHSFVLTDFAVDSGRIPGKVEASSEAARTKTASFVADKVGVFKYICGVPFDEAMMNCAPDHEDIVGFLVVLEP